MAEPEGESENEDPQNPASAAYWYQGRLLWIGNELFAVTKMGEKRDGSSLIPVDVKKVEW